MNKNHKLIFAAALYALILPNVAYSHELEAGKPVTIGVHAMVNEPMMIDGVCYEQGEIVDCADMGVEPIQEEPRILRKSGEE